MQAKWKWWRFPFEAHEGISPCKCVRPALECSEEYYRMPVSAEVCQSRRIIVSISYVLCKYKSFGDNYLTIPMYLAESIQQKTVMGTIKLQAQSQSATDLNSVWINCWKPHLYRKGFWAHTESSLHGLTHDLTTTRNGKFCCCLCHSKDRAWVCLCVWQRGSPFLQSLIEQSCTERVNAPISDTSSPDKGLFIYLEQVNKLAPKQKAVFQNHASRKSRWSDFRDCGCAVVLFSAVSVFQGALSGFQPL